MSLLPIPSLEQAPEASQATLTAVKGKYGFVPNLLAGLAHAPAALHGYLALADLVAKTSLSPAEQQTVALAVSTENGCGYCVAAHSVLAGQVLSASQIAALRSGEPTGAPRIDALARFARAVVRARGWVEARELAAFLAAGFAREQVLEVLLGVAQKTLSNYANHLLETPLDSAFESARWNSAETTTA